MVETVRKLGPLGMPQKFEEWDREMHHLEASAKAQETLPGQPAPSASTMEAAHA
jgi:hypothetical protein